MQSEHYRSSSNSSVTSPIPIINIVSSQQKSNGKDGDKGQSMNSRGSNSDLLDIFNKRISQSKDKNSRDKSSSRGKSPGRSKSSDKRGKSPSGRKSPTGDKLLGSPKRSSSRSRSPGPRSKSPNSPNSPNSRETSRSKSPKPNNHSRVGSDSMNRSASQDARLNSGGKLQPWIASSTTEKNGNSRNSNRLSLPPNFSDFNINSVIRESNERWARLNLVPSDKDNKSGSMGNFSKTTSLRMNMNSITRPKLSVETFSNLFNSKSMQRTPSGGRTGNSSSSPLLAAGGFPLVRSRSFNSAMDNTQRVPASLLKELEKPHPLEHSWTMYYDSKPAMTPGPKTQPGKLSYEENLQTIGTFDTVETFCRYFNWVKKPSQLEPNTNFHIFKNKIKPMWEDPANANGGKWVISIRNNQLLDRCWTWLVYALVGEELDENDDICGAVMSRRARGDRIAVWVRDKDNVPVINGIGRRLLKILDLQNEKGIGMDFQFNEDALKSGTSYNNRVYLSLESLKQELESEEKAKKELADAEKRQAEVKDSENTPEIVTIDVDAELERNDENISNDNAKEEKPQTESKESQD